MSDSTDGRDSVGLSFKLARRHESLHGGSACARSIARFLYLIHTDETGKTAARVARGPPLGKLRACQYSDGERARGKTHFEEEEIVPRAAGGAGVSFFFRGYILSVGTSRLSLRQ